MGLKLIIAGAGVSGLSLAAALSSNPDIDLTVLEALDRPGGKIWSDKVKGYLCESGVNGFLNSKPATLELASELSLTPLKSSDAARVRFIYSGGALQRLPESPPAFFKSKLISMSGKARLALEPFIAKGIKEDESLADFGRRRLGVEAFEKLIDPMASGVFAGDPEALSLKSCFPVINNLEQTHGSLIRAMIKLMAERKKQVSAAPRGVLTSFMGGMQELIDGLKAVVGDRLRTGAKLVSVERLSKGYALHLADGSRLEAEAVVIATPAHQTTGIIKDIDPAVSNTLAEIPYPPLSVVCLGFRREKINISVDAFGFLVPFRENRRVLGTLYDSSVFPNRAPEGHVLLRSMVGGARFPHLAMQDDKIMLDSVMAEIKKITGLSADPDFHTIYRHEQAIPQYNVGHFRRVEAVAALEARTPGLYITGNAFKGVSVNDCIDNSRNLAKRITEELI